MLKLLFGSRISVFEVIGALLAAIISYYGSMFNGLILLACVGVIHIIVCKRFDIQ